jgi:hypothetical protein
MLITGYQARLNVKPPSLLKFRVQPNFNCFLYEAVHVSCCLVQHGGTAEVNVMPGVDAMLCHGRLFGLFEAYVPHMLAGSPGEFYYT